MAIPDTSSTADGNLTLASPMRQAVDDMLAHYISWREAAAAVRAAYARCSRAPDGEEDGGFSAYLAALDQEEASAASYAHALSRVEALL